ncbi:MAG: YibE/F family protein [Anaerolineales bacterium]|nr:YibE/F family protein [Anaerolineales bacterium]
MRPDGGRRLLGGHLEPVLFIVLGLLVVLAVMTVLAEPRGPTEQSDGSSTAPQAETMRARVIEVIEEGAVELGEGVSQPYQRLLLRVESGSLAGEEVVVEEGTINVISQDRLFSVGDRVFLERTAGPQGDRLYISDFNRTSSLVWIIVLFVVLVVLVGRGKGLRAMAGTVFSLVIIFGFILPQIIAGRDPVLVSIAGAVVLLSVSTYLVYGWNQKAHAAVAGMMLSLALTGALAWLFARWARLTGLSEEGGFLIYELGGDISLRGIVLGGIIIGSLGVLDDICVGQASAIFELANANRGMSWRQLLRSGLNIGRDHIAAMVNTLLLAYVGASMPLMLAFMIYQDSFLRRINREPIAEEIIRTMVGSIGLVLAVPITALIASLLARWMVERERSAAETATVEQA